MSIRLALAVTSTFAALTAGVLAPPAAAAPVPVLGQPGFDTWDAGFGTARPPYFSMAQTASSTVSNINWESWGGPTAVGLGRTQASMQTVDVWVQAGDLGWCNGKWAYRTVKRAGSRSTIASTGAEDICT